MPLTIKLARFTAILVLAALAGLANGHRTGIAMFQPYQQEVAVPLPAGVKPATLSEAREAFALGSHVFIDARPAERFEAGHIDGAISLPYHSLSAALAALELPLTEDLPVIVYGEAPEDESAARVAEELKRLGLIDIRIFPNGWQA